MKAKKLAEKLLQHPELEVTVHNCESGVYNEINNENINICTVRRAKGKSYGWQDGHLMDVQTVLINECSEEIDVINLINI